MDYSLNSESRMEKITHSTQYRKTFLDTVLLWWLEGGVGLGFPASNAVATGLVVVGEKERGGVLSICSSWCANRME